MTKSETSVTTEKKTWTKPELTLLGKLADVAGGPPVPVQNINNS